MDKILDSINCPDDVRKLELPQLEELAEEIRHEICNVVSKTGGHLAPSLGVVELTIALHSILDCPKDKIVWDVGHQSYTHKIITGRREQFPTIRCEGGISGFPNIGESESDAFGTGHAATAISAALGLAVARDIKGTDEKVVAVVGDGAMTGGLCFEGLNNAGASKRDLLVILNDNKMSISPNVGALANYLTDVISTKKYNRLKKEIWELTGFIPALGQPVRTALRRLERSLKSFIVPGSWFENLGFRYFGPVDGHDLKRLKQIIEQLQSIKGPLLLHVYTTKGKGYCYAEEDATRFHGISAFDMGNGKSISKSERPSYSKVLSRALCEIARSNSDVCAITAAMKDSVGLGPFSDEFPDRFFDVGIAEQHAVTFAGGLARSGLKPYVALYSSFLQRSYDNVLHDVALQNLPVVFCIDRAGFVGEDGPTHHGVFDISYLRHIPGMVVLAPKDENEFRDMLNFASTYMEGPLSIRYPRGTGTASEIKDSFDTVELGKAEVLVHGDDATVLAVGEMVTPSLEAAGILSKEGINITVVNMRFICPLDTKLLDTLLGQEKAKIAGLIDKVTGRGKPVFTVEENVLAGGFGSSVLEYCSEKGYTPHITMIGIPNIFVSHAKRSRLLSKYGLDADSIAKSIRKAVSS